MKRRDFLKASAGGGLLIGILAAIGHTADEDADVDPISTPLGRTADGETQPLNDCDS